MGIGLVLIVYAVVLVIAATIGSAVCTSVVRKATRGLRESDRAVRASFWIPWICVIWCGLWFAGYATVNELVFHSDPMIGDTWSTEIGHDDSINFIDLTEEGILSPSGSEEPGSENLLGTSGVRRLQVTACCLYGSLDEDYFHDNGENGSDTGFFALEGKERQRRNFGTEAELTRFAGEHGDRLQLEPVYQIYLAHRKGWFDRVAGLVLIALPLVGFGMFAQWVWRLRRNGFELTEG